LVQRKSRIMRVRDGKQAKLYDVVYAKGSIEFYLIHKIRGVLKGSINFGFSWFNSPKF